MTPTDRRRADSDHPETRSGVGGRCLLSFAFFWLVIQGCGSTDPATNLPASYFSPDYATARSRFLKLTRQTQAELTSLELTAKGPSDESLAIDIAWFGAHAPRRAMVHSSGIHGVEGFAGSAIQLRWLTEGLPEIPEHGAIVIVHVLNPYGMAWLRRYNENNVDLNRNFLGPTLVHLGSRRRARLTQLVLKDRTGRTLSKIGQPQLGMQRPSVSPDGRRVAVGVRAVGNTDVWVHQVTRPVKTRLTFDESLDRAPTWLPSGDAISFTSERAGDRGLYVKAIGGDTLAERLLSPASTRMRYLSDWSSDARLALFEERPVSERGAFDLWYLERSEDGGSYQAQPFLQTQFAELSAQFSPDEKWVAYSSNESGRYEVYVRSFPDGGGKQQVSIEGGEQPRWSQKGQELFYVEDATLMTVAVSTRPTLTIGKPRELFSSRFFIQADHTYRYDKKRIRAVRESLAGRFARSRRPARWK